MTQPLSLFLDLDVAPDVVADLREIAFHAVGIFVVDDFQQLFQLGAYLGHVLRGVGVEEHFLQQVVVFVEHALGDAHVALEGGSGCILMLHHGRKDERGDEGDGQRVSHRAVVFFEGVFVDVESQTGVEVLEEDAADEVALVDDDGILLGKLVKIGECGAEHGVCADVVHARALVEVLQSGLHGGDIAEDTLLGKMGNDLLEGGNGVFHRNGIDAEFGLELVDFFELGEAQRVVGEAEPLGIALIDGHFVFETKQVDEEAAHLSCT